MMNQFEFTNPANTFTLSTRKALGHYTMQANHFHHQHELYYLLSGEREYFIKDRTYSVHKGDLVFINAYELHKTTDTGVPNHERVLIKFSEEFLKTAESPMIEVFYLLTRENQCLIRPPIRTQNLFEEIFQKMLKEIEEQEVGFEAVLQALLIQLLVAVCRISHQKTTATFDHLSQVHEKISEVVQFINHHYAEEISLQLLSEKFFISPFYLSRTFKEVTGFTFIEYLNTVRIKEAQKLLRESKLKVIIIAENVGFGNIAHFGRVFKKVTGITPMQYKKNNTLF